MLRIKRKAIGLLAVFIKSLLYVYISYCCDFTNLFLSSDIVTLCNRKHLIKKLNLFIDNLVGNYQSSKIFSLEARNTKLNKIIELCVVQVVA